jgi:cytochrome c-type biogenesis protein CcmH
MVLDGTLSHRVGVDWRLTEVGSKIESRGRETLRKTFRMPLFCRPSARISNGTASLSFDIAEVISFAALLLALLASGASAQSSPRAKAIGQRLMCVCGCNEVLTACNHVGCTYSRAMLKELDARVARGESDDLILQDFVQEYGPTVLVDPPKRGFTSLVWIAPIVVPIVAFFLIWELAKRWKHRAVLATAGGPKISPDLLARARQESDKESNE